MAAVCISTKSLPVNGSFIPELLSFPHSAWSTTANQQLNLSCTRDICHYIYIDGRYPFHDGHILRKKLINKWSMIPYMLCSHCKWHLLRILTLIVRVKSYHGLTRSISWLLMAWLLALPSHQQPCYWLSKLGLVLLEEGFQLSVACQCETMIWNANICFCYLRKH